MKLPQLKLQQKFKFAMAAITLAAAGLVMMPHDAKASSVSPTAPKWLSRAVIQSDNNQVFVDSNTYDTTYEYVERDGGTCPNKITFSSTLPRFKSDAERNIYFFYQTNSEYYNQHFVAVYYNGSAQSSAAGNTSQCKYAIDASILRINSPNNRRYTWWRNSTQGDGNTITNIITGVAFARKTDFNGVNRFFRVSELADTNNVCPDLILLHRAHPTGAAEDVFQTDNSDLAESSILFSVQKDDSLSRTSEDYNVDSEPNGDSVGPGTCHVRSQSLNKKQNGDMPQFSGDIENDQFFFTSGLNDRGNTNANDDTGDDAFVTFIGDENNLPKKADGTIDNGPTSPITDAGNSDTVDQEVCKGGALGWILCPIVRAIQTTVDLIRSGIEYMLTVQPFKIDANDPVYIIWDNFRNFANILYVFAFFAIIFSQATSIGISNLGAKRLLPKIFIFAIASNASYYICVAAVDFFNVLGVGVYNLVAIANGGSSGTVDISTSVGLAGIASAGLAAGGLAALIYTGAIVELFPLLVAAFIGIIITFVVLVLRQMLIIAIVASSALIITLGLFDENIPKKIGNMGFLLLLMYPMIVFGFAVARLASALLTSAAGNTTAGAFVGGAALLLQVAMAVSAIFLFKMAIVAKSVLGRAAGAISDRTKGLTNRARERGQRSQFYQNRQIARQQRQAERQRGTTQRYAETITGEGWRAWMLRRRAGGYFNAAGQNRAYVSGLGQVSKLEEQETKDADFVLKNAGIQAPVDLAKIAGGQEVNGIRGAGNAALQRAAIRKIINAEDAEGLEMMFMNNYQQNGVTVPMNVNQDMLVKEVREQYSKSKSAGAHLVKLDAKPPGTGYSDIELQRTAVTELSKLSWDKLAGQDGPAIERALAGLRAGYGTPAERSKLRDSAIKITTNDVIFKGSKDSAREPLKSMTGITP